MGEPNLRIRRRTKNRVPIHVINVVGHYGISVFVSAPGSEQGWRQTSRHSFGFPCLEFVPLLVLRCLNGFFVTPNTVTQLIANFAPEAAFAVFVSVRISVGLWVAGI